MDKSVELVLKATLLCEKNISYNIECEENKPIRSTMELKLYGSIITQKPKMVLSPRSFILKFQDEANTKQAIEIKMALWTFFFSLESGGNSFLRF